MKCPICEQDNPSAAKYCLGCGARLGLECSACSCKLPPGSQVLYRMRRPRSVARAAAAPRFTAPDAYTPKFLAEKILTSRADLEGERKHVTVLFADIRGSLELLDGRDPEEARALLDPALHTMMEAVHRYEGTVNQVLGDGIMALFGAPLAHEDHALRACYAALRMQEAIRGYADEVRRKHGLNLQVRVGLNSGEVVVRAIGNDLSMEYSAVGETTHLAARMEQLATPGTVLATQTVARLAGDYLQLNALGPVPVRGRSEPVEIFEIAGTTATRTRLQAAVVKGLTPFVGRTPSCRRWEICSTVPRAERARWPLWSASREWASRACAGSCARCPRRAASSSSKGTRSPTARAAPTTRSSSCCAATSRSRKAIRGASGARRSWRKLLALDRIVDGDAATAAVAAGRPERRFNRRR